MESSHTAVRCSGDVDIAPACCWSTPAPYVEPCERFPGMSSRYHHLPAMAMGLWVPQTFQALTAALQAVVGLAEAGREQC